MLLVTWNVNSLRARLPRVLEFCAEHEPEVLCLQETKVGPDDFPHDALAEAGYHAVHHSGGRGAGVAILAPLDHQLADPVLGLPGEAAPEEARWVEATVSGMRVVSAYVPNGRAVGTAHFEAKLRFFEAATERVAELGDRALAVTGDLNVTRGDLDVYDPQAFAGSTHVTPEERGRFEAVLETGLHDAYRHLDPDGVGYTWWDYRQGHFHRKMGLRIDYVLLSTPLAAGLTECGIDRTYRKGPKPSDHAPLLARLDTAP
ncbi:MAG: exodeoxyribonuclease III [Solirubrobacterales bacterium]